MLEQLPDHILIKIFQRLDYRSLLRLSHLHSRFSRLCDLNEFWAVFCERFWCLDVQQPAGGYGHNWKNVFRDKYANLGRYISCYRAIKTAWDKILGIISEKAPPIRQSLLPGLTEDQLLYVEKRLGLQLPNDLRCSYTFFNGQRPCGDAQGLLGSYDTYLHGDFLFPLLGIFHGTVVEKDDFDCIPIAGANAHSLPIRICLRSCPSLCLKSGLVFCSADNSSQIYNSVFQLADSFEDFLTQFANKLSNSYPVVQNTVLKYEPNSSVQTGPISVSVATSFVREHSYLSTKRDQARFSYHYRITLKMDANAKREESCQLFTRHWIITDENGKEDFVDDQGVVGAYPIMAPGEEYTYISGTSFSTKYGKMEGHYTFLNLETGTESNVAIAPFHMRCPTLTTLAERQKEWKDE